MCIIYIYVYTYIYHIYIYYICPMKYMVNYRQFLYIYISLSLPCFDRISMLEGPSSVIKTHHNVPRAKDLGMMRRHVRLKKNNMDSQDLIYTTLTNLIEICCWNGHEIYKRYILILKDSKQINSKTFKFLTSQIASFGDVIFFVKQISSVFAFLPPSLPCCLLFHLRSQVGGLPDRMKMEVIEPLRPRLIDEVGWKCAAWMVHPVCSLDWLIDWLLDWWCLPAWMLRGWDPFFGGGGQKWASWWLRGNNKNDGDLFS